MKLIFVRHPETEANVRKVIYGRTDSWYSPKGLESVGWVVNQLSSVTIDQIYSSRLKRASYLAEKISKDHNGKSPNSNLIVEYDDRLLERHFGIFENKSHHEAKELYGKGFDRLWQDVADFEIPEGETLRQVKDRVSDFLEELKATENVDISIDEKIKNDPVGAIEPENCSEKTVLVVAHSMVMRCALSSIMNIPLEDIWHFDIKPAAIVEVVFRHGYGMLTKLMNPDT